MVDIAAAADGDVVGQQLQGHRHRDWRHQRVDGRQHEAGITLRVPRPGLCTDNGAMVAALGAHLLAGGAAASPLDLPANSSMPVTEVLVSSSGRGS